LYEVVVAVAMLVNCVVRIEIGRFCTSRMHIVRFAVVDSADDYPAYRIFRYGRRDVSILLSTSHRTR
jgi:hypothetical protein